MFTRCASILPLAGFMLLSARHALAQSSCLAYNIDFVNGGSYFINTNSNASFTCVTEFQGCQSDTADIILSGPDAYGDPTGTEVYCSDIPLQPDLTPELSTCPILKDEMVSGTWDITIISNNGDADPIAYQAEFYITAGPQQTVTATPTLLANFTTTPTVTSTSTNILTANVTVSNSKTITIPSATAVTTVTPKPTTVTATTTLTYTWKAWTRTAIITTSTVTATCTVPPRPQNPAPWWHFKPQIVQSLPSGLSAPNSKRDNAFAIRDALRAERRGRTSEQMEADAIDKRDLVKRSADAPTVTVTETTFTITSTSTYTGTTSTVLTIVPTTTTSTTTLPPATVYYGEAYSTVTASQFTRTKLSVTTTWTVSVGTITAALTHWSTVTPTASVSACKSKGGHFGPIWA